MHFSTALAAVAAVVPIVNAHNGPGLPGIIGLNMKDLKARNLLDNLKTRAAEIAREESQKDHEKRELRARQGGTDGQCGGSFGSCAPGYCCSEAGWCGNTADYCYSPGCQYKYGSGCPENITPAGTNTSTVARTKVGSVLYGGDGIYECTTPGTIALTYDDGPLQNYTNHILDIFQSYNAKATFFITGNNIGKGEIDTTPELKTVIQRAYNAGHQIASHTWTHLDLSAISATDRLNQMYKNEMALRNILGVFPTYMRPPYSSCTAASGCEQAMANLGYHVVYFNVDTDDYQQDAANRIQNSKNWFKGNITAGGATSANSEWLSISHDIHLQTAYNLTEYMLSTLTQLGYKPVTVGECLGDPSANWYRSSSGSGSTTTTTTSTSSTKISSTKTSSTTASTSSTKTSSKTSSAPTSTSTLKVSTDATCGGTNKYTCKGSSFGNCCSVNGWCGSTSDYCGTGCQSAYGLCGSAATTSTAPAATATAISTDGQCGGSSGKTCQGSSFGNCCSQYGWCGSTTGHCGTGCQSAFGTCS